MHFRSDVSLDAAEIDLLGDLKGISARFAKLPKTCVVDGDHPQAESLLAHAVVPLIYQGGCVGFLLVRTDDPSRVWADNELMLLHTVADQLAVASIRPTYLRKCNSKLSPMDLRC